MVRSFVLFVGLLGGCAPEARDIALSDVDLSDMQTVQTIRNQLRPREGIAFANYVVKHHVKSANYCGQPLFGADGEAPETVGEAIDLAARRDAANRSAFVRSRTPEHTRKPAMENWESLIRDRDILIDAQSRLRSQYGNGAKRRPEWKPLEIRMAEIDETLIGMKSKAFGSGD